MAAAAIFVAGFMVAREVRASLQTVSVPSLVRSAQIVDGLRYVTADQAIQATRQSTAPVFVDVRTSQEFGTKHIQGALNIQDFQVPDAIPTLPNDRAWVMYCTCPDDHLAKWAAAAVEATGLPNAVVLEHGLQGWQTAGGEVVVPEGVDPAVQQGCGCTLGAPAVKLWALEHFQAPDANRSTP